MKGLTGQSGGVERGVSGPREDTDLSDEMELDDDLRDMLGGIRGADEPRKSQVPDRWCCTVGLHFAEVGLGKQAASGWNGAVSENDCVAG